MDMEELSDLDLCEASVSDVDNLCLVMDIPDEDMGMARRPSSTASFSSWTFSPIQEEEVDSDIQDPCIQSTSREEGQPDSQQVYIVNQPISSHQQPQAVINLSKNHMHQTNNSASEYHYPNNITYHHQVNIHNYVGNYCVPTPLYKDACMWENVGQGSLPATSDCRFSQGSAQMLKAPDKQATRVMSSGKEFTRCSTPDFIMALNSLNQLDSPPRPNHSAALDFCGASFDDSVNQSNSVRQQDSGYSSDLNVSPVIQFQGNPVKVEGNQPVRRQTSTPNSYQPYLKTPMQLFKNDSLVCPHPVHMPQTFPMPMPMMGFQPKLMCPSRHTSNWTPQHFPASLTTLQQMRQQFPKRNLETAPTSTGLTVETIADHHKTLKKEPQAKPKAKPVPKLKLAEVTDPASRRRHNEPLNNQALQVMNDWYQNHMENPYPNKQEKEQLAKAGGITIPQVKSWFANKRNRNNNTRPKKKKIEMEERLMDLCHQLARDAGRPTKDNAYYIQQLSSIIDTTKEAPVL